MDRNGVVEGGSLREPGDHSPAHGNRGGAKSCIELKCVVPQDLKVPSRRPRAATADNWHAAAHRRRLSREAADEILRLADSLPSHESALIRAVFRDEKPITEVAALLEQPARKVRERVRRLVARVRSPHFDFVVRRAQAWPDLRRRVAHAVVVMGDTYRTASRRLGVSLHTVRREYAAVLAMAEATNQLAAEVRGLESIRA